MEFKDLIKTRRLEIGRTLEEVALDVGVSKATVQRWESGNIKNIKRDKILKLAYALKTSPAYLMGWTDNFENKRGESSTNDVYLTIQARTENEAIHKAVEIAMKASGFLGSDDSISEEEAMKFYKANSGTMSIGPLASSAPEEIGTPYHPTRRIPILGCISAGLPIYAEQHIEGYTYTDLNGGNEYFGLRVHGDSMNAMNINEGNVLIVRRQSLVENGDIAVVLVDGECATVKRFYQSGNVVTLLPQSTNPEHSPQMYDLKKVDVNVLGKVVQNQIMFE